jgi:hypothetical protein
MRHPFPLAMACAALSVLAGVLVTHVAPATLDHPAGRAALVGCGLLAAGFVLAGRQAARGPAGRDEDRTRRESRRLIRLRRQLAAGRAGASLETRRARVMGPLAASVQRARDVAGRDDVELLHALQESVVLAVADPGDELAPLPGELRGWVLARRRRAPVMVADVESAEAAAEALRDVLDDLPGAYRALWQAHADPLTREAAGAAAFAHLTALARILREVKGRGFSSLRFPGEPQIWDALHSVHTIFGALVLVSAGAGDAGLRPDQVDALASSRRAGLLRR